MSCFCCFPAESVVEHLALGADEFLSRKACAFCSCVCLYLVLFRMQQSTEKGQSSSPRYRCVRSCSSISSQVIMFLLLSCTVEGGSRVSSTRSRQVPLKEGVCIFAVAAVVHVYCCFDAAEHRK